MSYSALRNLTRRSLLLSMSLIFVPGVALVAEAQVALVAQAQTAAFTQSLAATASADEAIAEWYRKTGYKTLWTGPEDSQRRAAFFAAIATARDHGLPEARYNAPVLMAALRAAETEGDRGRVEVEMTRAYLAWARDLTSGALEPMEIDSGIVREINRIDPQVLLARIANGDPEVVLAWLQPKSVAYLQLMNAKFGLEAQIDAGGWGETVSAGSISPGDTGAAVIQLRDRLIRMGYLAPTATASYDRALQAAVTAFQLNHGLTADGAAGEGTIVEINRPPEDRLKSVIVAMERERWMKVDTSQRYVWVNLPDFRAKVIDRGKVVYDTRAVIGKNTIDRRTPEFSDVMEHMVINPSWNVPRSITVKEYLPLLQSNPNAVSHLQVLDGRGRVVSRGAVNFGAYSAGSFPYALRQPPSDSNALGKVKFMFPNVNNIYLHDTPAKDLFAKEIRDYSHGCIRLADPFDFAYYLLGSQTADPERFFAATIETGDETTVKLDAPLPVHLVYFTAYPDAKGRITYRRDVYGRDAALFGALSAAGVELAGVQG